VVRDGAGTASTAIFRLAVDDAFGALYVNGTNLGSHALYEIHPPTLTYDIRSLLVTGRNVIAVYGKNDGDTNGAGVCYQVTLS